MPINALAIDNFYKLFTGSKEAYGIHDYNFSSDGKKEDGTNRTVKKQVRLDHYTGHLEGKRGLGIIPITQGNKCKFVVIDIDIYDREEDLQMFMTTIEDHKFPIVPFRSKSGGLHLYVFFKDLTIVKQAVEAVQLMIAVLSLDIYYKRVESRMVEVFPKQKKVSEVNREFGSWINLPYFNALDTKQGVVYRGEMLELNKGLAYAASRKTDVDSIRAFVDNLPFSDAPPCLQTMYLLNVIGEHDGRNNYLFSFCAYLKKKDENFFEPKLFEINESLLAPLETDEIERTIIQSHKRKDYTYKCTEHPCVLYCNKPMCKNREFGIGKQDGYFSNLEYGLLTQVRTSRPYYEWQIKKQGALEFITLRFKNEDEIIKQDAFLRLCFRELHMLPYKLKQSEWIKIVNQSLVEVIIDEINEQDYASAETMFKNYFVEFITTRAKAETKEQLLNSLTYYSKQEDVYYFRVKDFSDFLMVKKQFFLMTPDEIHPMLKDMGCTSGKCTTESRKQIRINKFPHKNLKKYSAIIDEEEARETFVPEYAVKEKPDQSHEEKPW